MDKIDTSVPMLQENFPPARALMCVPQADPIVMSVRRPNPTSLSIPNNDTAISISTIEGTKKLPVEMFLKFINQMKPDLVLAPPDVPNLSPGLPGNNRARKMALRTEKWLLSTLQASSAPVIAPMLPGVSQLTQKEYLQVVQDNAHNIAGLSFWQLTDQLSDNPKNLIGPVLDLVKSCGLDRLMRFMAVDCLTPQAILDSVSGGYDLFQGDIATQFTDLGLALDITFPAPKETEIPLGFRDLWDDMYINDLGPLSESIESCVQAHHRAYINHLLKAKEMTAWVYLQMHNLHVLHQFFQGIRESIKNGSFEADHKQFVETYGSNDELLTQLSQLRQKNVGPTIKGHTSSKERF